MKRSNLPFLGDSRRMFPAAPRNVPRRLLSVGALLAGCILLRCVLLPRTAAAEEPAFQVIVHPQLTADRLERGFVAAAFLKKVTRWENGESIHPVDLSSKSTTRSRFSEAVLKRSVTAVRNYWQQRIFSGQDVPPPEVQSELAAVQYV